MVVIIPEMRVRRDGMVWGNKHKCFWRLRKLSPGYPCYLFWCERCAKARMITKASYWR